MDGVSASSDTANQDVYESRELSWLLFNRRVLEEAANNDNPALERLKYLSITASNLDEFFMVRFAALRREVLQGNEKRDTAGLLPSERMERILHEARIFMENQLEILREHVLPPLSEAGLRFLSFDALTDAQALWAEKRFKRDILPKLSLAICDKARPFPQISGRVLHLGVLFVGEKKETSVPATVRIPHDLPRVWRLPKALGEGMLLLEEMIIPFVGQLAPEKRVLGCWPYRVTRDADFTVEDDSAEKILAETKKSLNRRKTGAVVRLEVRADAPDTLVKWLCAVLPTREKYVFRLDGPLNLAFLLKEVYGAKGRHALRYPPFEGRMPAAFGNGTGVFDAIRAGDVFLHHPYDSFDAVLRFVKEAAADPRTLAIQQTLYRVSGNSPVIKALCDAAEAGKRVTVLLEVKARFDEENNLHWGEVLEHAGCRVIYGLPTLKTHSKITLVVRREEEGLRRYIHLGTGNYNDVTAKQYTDMGLFTCDEDIGEDARAFFNMITGFSQEPFMKKLVYAPQMLRHELSSLIEAEIDNARAGKPSGIMAKMNALTDTEIISQLYEASRAGVRVDLIVRGVCCLRAGIEGQSETITVRSIVGRFLEHSRVFRFENGGDARIFLSSADWMPRNLNRRVELMFPIEDAAVRGRVEEVLRVQWQDTVKSWEMRPDGRYARIAKGESPVDAQMALCT